MFLSSEVINAGIQLIPVLYFVKSLNSLLRLKKEIRKCSVVFDFTAGDSFSDLYGFKRFLKVSITKIITILCQKPLILGPQTYGPFKSPSVQMIAGAIIKKSTYVCTRDVFSADLVKKLYGEEVDVFIGTRMHATIRAFSSHVATIPFSYSYKFEGLYGSLGYLYFRV